MRIARLIALVNLTSWSEHALTTVNSAATVIGITAAALALLSIGIIYFTSSELSARIRTKTDAVKAVAPPVLFGNADHRNGNDSAMKPAAVEKTSRMAELQTELAAARKAEESKGSRVAQLNTELVKMRRTGEATEAHVAQLQSELTHALQSEEGKASRLAELERQLAETRRSDEGRAARVSQLEKEMAGARQSADQANAQTKQIESKQGPRRITPEQRKQFSEATRGLATGKVIVSAFFDNKETHDFGAEVLGLLKDAGFEVRESAPANFFTTSRPSSGIRIGCLDMSNPPPHFATVRKAFAAIGLEAPDTTVVNADELRVVEIQITPRQ